MASTQTTDIAIIGAGPAGSTAAALLRDRGWQVTVLERSHFPRFSIGESLLPQCMDLLAEADLLKPLDAANFQVKNGVGFVENDKYGQFDFDEQYSDGWDWTWHVVRASFDQIIASQAAERGADVRFGESIETVDFSTPGAPRLHVVAESGERYAIDARFVCDASGAGRVLPKLLDLSRPADAPPRAAMFTHVRDRITAPDFKRDNILISIHPQHPDVWHWLIPFRDGRSSIGVVGDPDFIAGQTGEPEQQLRALTAQEPCMADLLADAIYERPVNKLANYASSVSRLHGRDYALLGNAGEFVDPIFSSGVTVALKSATLASDLIDRQLRGRPADWNNEFDATLRAGVRVFASFIKAWYDGSLKHVFFTRDAPTRIRSMLGSVLAGYVWDSSNPYVIRPERRLRALCDACAP